jgi:lipid A 4'-phosphatase
MSRFTHSVQEYPARWALGVLALLMMSSVWDEALSRVFYEPESGFSWDRNGVLEFVRNTLPNIVIGSLIVCLAVWLFGFFKIQYRRFITTPQMTYLVLTLLIGPGLIVETLLKSYWGRARPKDIIPFGGEAAYTFPWEISDACLKNCSFVSGHAAVAFWVTAYAFLLPPKWRALGLLAGLSFGFAVGFVRIAQGGHFLSDVVAAGFIVILINELLSRPLLKPPAET